MRSFIYCPNSGDRVIAQKDSVWVRVTRWVNGCRHADGGVRLTYESAMQGSWWRDGARAMAASIIEATGGIAWDDQGDVSLQVPAHWALEADRWMQAAAKEAGAWLPQRNFESLDARLIRHGIRQLRRGESGSLVAERTRVTPLMRPGVLEPFPTWDGELPTGWSPSLNEEAICHVKTLWEAYETGEPYGPEEVALRACDENLDQPRAFEALARLAAQHRISEQDARYIQWQWTCNGCWIAKEGDQEEAA